MSTMYDNRPGTSFTSKRQIQTEQRKRQLNVGTLETEDKSLKNIRRPMTQDQQRNTMQSRKDKRSRAIPCAIIQDRESLYEEVINMKQANNLLQRDKLTYQTRLKQMEEEIHRIVKVVPSNETLMNPMESYYQNDHNPLKPIKQQLVIDLKKQVRRQQEDIKQKDIQITALQKNTKLLKYRECEKELYEYQNEAARLKGMLAVMLASDVEKWEDNATDLILGLKQENVELQQQLANLQESNKITIIKSREFETKANKYLAERISRDKLIEFLKTQIEALKFRDPEYKQVNKVTEVEVQLKVELDNRQAQIDTLIHSLRSKENQYTELDKRLKEQEREFQNIIDSLERDKLTLKDQVASLKEETAQQSGRRRTVQSFSIDNKLEILPEGPEIQDVKHKKQLPCVSKEEVTLISKELRYKLRLSRISLNQLDQYLFLGESTYTITIDELFEVLQNSPFLLTEEHSLMLARYLVEDNEEKMVDFNMSAESTAPRVRSILKNLIGNYTLLDAHAEEQLFSEIAQIITKYRVSMEDYILKVKKQSDLCSIDELEDALKFVEMVFNSQQMDYLCLQNFKQTQNLVAIDYKLIFRYFHQELHSAKQLTTNTEKMITQSEPKSSPQVPQKQSIRLKQQETPDISYIKEQESENRTIRNDQEIHEQQLQQLKQLQEQQQQQQQQQQHQEQLQQESSNHAEEYQDEVEDQNTVNEVENPDEQSKLQNSNSRDNVAKDISGIDGNDEEELNDNQNDVEDVNESEDNNEQNNYEDDDFEA